MVIVGFLVDANLKINKKRGQLSEQRNELENQVRELGELKAQYEQGLLEVQTDEFWEERLREQGYTKPGEEVFVVVLPDAEIEGDQTVKEKTFWQRVREKLGF